MCDLHSLALPALWVSLPGSKRRGKIIASYGGPDLTCWRLGSKLK